jgi:hypothetical protein
MKARIINQNESKNLLLTILNADMDISKNSTGNPVKYTKESPFSPLMAMFNGVKSLINYILDCSEQENRLRAIIIFYDRFLENTKETTSVFSVFEQSSSGLTILIRLSALLQGLQDFPEVPKKERLAIDSMLTHLQKYNLVVGSLALSTSPTNIKAKPVEQVNPLLILKNLSYRTPSLHALHGKQLKTNDSADNADGLVLQSPNQCQEYFCGEDWKYIQVNCTGEECSKQGIHLKITNAENEQLLFESRKPLRFDKDTGSWFALWQYDEYKEVRANMINLEFDLFFQD